MPALDDARREKFCIEVASGKTHTDAYRLIYKTANKGSNIGANASRLSKENEVILRIRELQDDQRKRIGVSLDHLLRELNAAYRLGRRNKQAGAMVQASMAKAKLLGYVVDRAEVEGTMRRPLREPSEIKQMSLTDWQEKFSPKSAANDPVPAKAKKAVEPK
jgi:phage terminase small subunit